MFFPFYLLPHYRTVGVKCQHEIIRCLKAFMNNKVNCFCNWFSSHLFKHLVFYAVLIGELSSCFYCNETIDSETILLSQRQTSVITSQEIQLSINIITYLTIPFCSRKKRKIISP